jgi:hypothetical protein
VFDRVPLRSATNPSPDGVERVCVQDEKNTDVEKAKDDIREGELILEAELVKVQAATSNDGAHSMFVV